MCDPCHNAYLKNMSFYSMARHGRLKTMDASAFQILYKLRPLKLSADIRKCVNKPHLGFSILWHSVVCTDEEWIFHANQTSLCLDPHQK